MLCSICNENPAVIFVNKKDEKGESKTVGYCMKCAKEQGINPIENIKKNTNLTDEELKDVASKLDQMLKGLAINIKAIDEEELNNLMNQENIDTNNEDGINALGSIFDNLFENSESNEENEGGSKKTKTKPKTSKKKKALDAYGTNLTLKAKNNQLDRVIGRDQEIERMIKEMPTKAFIILEDYYREGEVNAVLTEHFSWSMKIDTISQQEKENYIRKDRR